jgi:hypothetical protein
MLARTEREGQGQAMAEACCDRQGRTGQDRSEASCGGQFSFWRDLTWQAEAGFAAGGRAPEAGLKPHAGRPENSGRDNGKFLRPYGPSPRLPRGFSAARRPDRHAAARRVASIPPMPFPAGGDMTPAPGGGLKRLPAGEGWFRGFPVRG